MEYENLSIAIVAFIAGNITGFFLNKFLSKSIFKFDIDGRTNYLIAIVSIVWLTSVLVDITSPTYETSPMIHGIMGAIVGFFFYRGDKHEK